MFVKSLFLFPPNKCLFCEIKTIKKQGKKEHLTKTFPDWRYKSSGWENIEKMAKEMQNDGYSSLLHKIAGLDLFAAEAHFYKSCYHNIHSKFQTFKGYHQSKSTEAKKKKKQELLCKAHVAAYKEIKAMIQKQVIAEHKILPLLMLRDRHINELQEQNQPNEKFRSDSLITKVRKGF